MTISDYLQNELVVKQVASETPVQFIKKNNDAIDFKQFINTYVPEFADGATDYLSPILFNAHLQTCFSTIRKFEDIDKINYKRYMITYPDGAQGALDIVVPNHVSSDYVPTNQLPFESPLKSSYSYGTPNDTILKSDDNKPMLVALHGLTGGSHESYVRSIVHTLTTEYNFESCVINSRGCCQSQITTPQLYNGGWTNDVSFVMNQLFQMYPNRSFYMIGFSLGASILSNYIGEQNDKIADRVKCAVVFGTPWDLVRSSHYINSTKIGAHVYSPALTRNLVTLTKRHTSILLEKPGFKDVYHRYIDSVKSVKEFDDAFTGPMFNYKNGMDYYKDASSVKRLAGVRIPLIGINAVDDPIVGGDKLPEKQISTNPYTMLIETSIGGHIAWFKDINGTRWFTDPVCKLLNTFHKNIVAKGYKPFVAEDNLPVEPVKSVRTTLDCK